MKLAGDDFFWMFFYLFFLPLGDSSREPDSFCRPLPWKPSFTSQAASSGFDLVCLSASPSVHLSVCQVASLKRLKQSGSLLRIKGSKREAAVTGGGWARAGRGWLGGWGRGGAVTQETRVWGRRGRRFDLFYFLRIFFFLFFFLR